jgi:hypothetical protein
MEEGRLKGMKVLVLTETEFILGEKEYYQEHFPRLGATVDFATNPQAAPSSSRIIRFRHEEENKHG